MTKKDRKTINQKCKTLLIANILLKRTDENHMISLTNIQSDLEAYGVSADIHTIGRNIKELMEFLDPDRDVDLPPEEVPSFKIVYDHKGKRGYKVIERPYDFQEVQLLAECVNSAKFISDSQADRFKEIIKNSLCSVHQAEMLDNEVYVYGRVKTKNNKVMGIISTINDAIKSNNKIKFQYMQYSLSAPSQQVPRRKGAFYIYSPFGLVSNNGNYYLLAYNSYSQKITTFRVDRMSNVSIIDEPREGSDEFNKIDLNTYTQRVFSMYSGEGTRVVMHFTNKLLDSVIDQFGTKEAFYSKVDDKHFSVSTNVEVSDQFFSWICSFRGDSVIVDPPEVVVKMKDFIDDIKAKYN